MFKEIESSASWKSVEKLTKGWSKDVKYKIETADGETLLLRLSDIECLEAKRKEYEILSKYATLGFCMSAPIAFGICNGGQSVYMLLSWVEGRDLEEVLSELTKEQQYQLGCEAGKILRMIHSLPVDAADVPAETKRAKKMLQLERYENCAVRIENDEIAIQYVKEHIPEIWKQTPVYLHGDFHPGNLIYREDGTIGVIDFNRWEVGDPYEEFYKLESFARELSVPYCIGQIEAYFDGKIPDDFWVTLAVYVAHASLFSVHWAEKFGQKEIEGMKRRCKLAFEDYDEFRRSVPVWYEERRRNGVV